MKVKLMCIHKSLLWNRTFAYKEDNMAYKCAKMLGSIQLKRGLPLLKQKRVKVSYDLYNLAILLILSNDKSVSKAYKYI